LALRIDDVDLQRDRRLVERFQEGDQTAFDTLYRRYFARLQRFCLKRVGDPHEAEEIAQEAFTRALRALPDLAGERRFYPWMTVIAGRLCVDHHRRRGRSEPAASIDLGTVDGGQEAIVEQADFALLAKALDRLAPRHREVLALREEQGWAYQQIADHYEVPVGTVEALLFRARKALKREFLAVANVGHPGERWAAYGAGAAPLLGGGWFGRHWALLKAKAAAVWSSSVGPVATPALGVAAVVGSVAAVGAGVMASDGLDRPRPPAVVRTTNELAVPASTVAPVPAAAPTSAPAQPSAKPAAAPNGGTARSGRVHVPTVQQSDVEVVTPEEAHDRSADGDVHLEQGGWFVGVYPDEVKDSVVNWIWPSS
jgi:RNA polymerase sigma-70 factor (ECF subfamily)